MTRWLMCSTAVLFFAAADVLLAAQPAAPQARPAVRAFVDRTAMWVGDRVNYTIEIVCPPGFDVLDEDLSKDRLKVDGLDVVSTETARSEAAGNIVRTFRYVLTSYRVDAATRQVAPAVVRYYATRPGQRLEEAAPAGEVQVPGTVIAFRSTLPEAQETYSLRDGRSAVARQRFFTVAEPVGIALIVLSIVPVAIWGIALAGRTRIRRTERSARQARKEERASLESADALDVSTPEGRREAYGQIDAVVRGHLREVYGVPGPGLTPAEVVPALCGRRCRIPSESVASLLAECEQARYAPLAAIPSAEACREAIAKAGQLVAGRR